MANPAKKGYEIDERAWGIIKTGVLTLQKYFSTPQDRKMYERKVDELFTNLRVDVREKVLVNGRADDTAGTIPAISTTASN